MKIRLAVLAALAAAATALPAAAQNMKAGLWEVSSKMTTDSGKLEKAMAEMQQQMANMPPEQRKMMEDMMSKQGVSMSSGGAGGGVTAKMCITKEMVAQNQLPIQQHGDCTSTHTPIVGNSMKVTFQCSKPPSSGEGQVTFTSDSSYNMKMKMKSTEAGKTEAMSVDASGKWLGADCGNIKPVMLPAAKPK